MGNSFYLNFLGWQNLTHKNKGSSDRKKLNDGEFMEKERLHQKKYHVLVEILSKAESKRESFKQGQESGNRTMKLKDLC